IFETIHLDTMHMTPSSNGCKYIVHRSNIVTDNAVQFTKVVHWLSKKYGIQSITIAPYNSTANGRIKRPHWDVRQALYKACEDKTKWYWFFWHVMWADRITVRKRFGCSPFFLVTRAHPILPLDLVEAT
ncbi:hypothetical protein J132_07491, partial [Termitomyces sp. J132]